MYSRRFFNYVNDNGSVYGVNRDESSTELLNLAADTSTVVINAVGLPKGLNTRKVKLKSADGLTKTVTILTRARYDALSLGSAFAEPVYGEAPVGTSFIIVAKIPERALRQPIGVDTGLVDGDNP